MPTPQPIAMPTSAAPASSPAMQAQPVAAAQPAVQAADDGDIIEREWVNRVRQIIAATAQDPYLQNKQLTELKAEYMQKRYNKVIKISD